MCVEVSGDLSPAVSDRLRVQDAKLSSASPGMILSLLFFFVPDSSHFYPRVQLEDAISRRLMPHRSTTHLITAHPPRKLGLSSLTWFLRYAQDHPTCILCTPMMAASATSPGALDAVRQVFHILIIFRGDPLPSSCTNVFLPLLREPASVLRETTVLYMAAS